MQINISNQSVDHANQKKTMPSPYHETLIVMSANSIYFLDEPTH